MDLFKKFVQSECMVGPDCRVLPSKLYNAYMKYRTASGLDTNISQKAFSMMINHIYPKVRIGRLFYRLGLCLKNDDDVEVIVPKSLKSRPVKNEDDREESKIAQNKDRNLKRRIERHILNEWRPELMKTMHFGEVDFRRSENRGIIVYAIKDGALDLSASIKLYSLLYAFYKEQSKFDKKVAVSALKTNYPELVSNSTLNSKWLSLVDENRIERIKTAIGEHKPSNTPKERKPRTSWVMAADIIDNLPRIAVCQKEVPGYAEAMLNDRIKYELKISDEPILDDVVERDQYINYLQWCNTKLELFESFKSKTTDASLFKSINRRINKLKLKFKLVYDKYHPIHNVDIIGDR